MDCPRCGNGIFLTYNVKTHEAICHTCGLNPKVMDYQVKNASCVVCKRTTTLYPDEGIEYCGYCLIGQTGFIDLFCTKCKKVRLQGQTYKTFHVYKCTKCKTVNKAPVGICKIHYTALRSNHPDDDIWCMECHREACIGRLSIAGPDQSGLLTMETSSGQLSTVE